MCLTMRHCSEAEGIAGVIAQRDSSGATVFAPDVRVQGQLVELGTYASAR